MLPRHRLRASLCCVLVVSAHALSSQFDSLERVKTAKKSPELTRRSALVGILGAAAVAKASSDTLKRPSLVEFPEEIEESTTPIVEPKKDDNEDPLVGLIAGSALTASSTLVRYPLDTATVRLQMPDPVDRTSIFKDCWKGVTKPLLANIPAGAVFFAIKDSSTHSLISDAGLAPTLATIIGVAVAQIPNWIVRNPSEVIKTQEQAGVYGVPTTFDSLDDRLRYYYKGFWVNIFYNYPADIIKFLVYDVLNQGSLDPWHGAVAGAVATIIAQVTTTPLDVVRNRVMALNTSDQQQQSSSYEEALVKLYRDGSLFAGAPTRVGRGMVSGFVQFAAFEETRVWVSQWLEGMQHNTIV